MANVVDPERVYINIQASAGITSTYLTTNPTATYGETRNPPVVHDISMYKAGIVRAELQGVRTIPLWMPPIDQTQADPSQTCFQLTVGLTTFSGSTSSSFPAAGTFSFDIQSFNLDGSILTPWKKVTVNHTTTAALYATAITTALSTLVTDGVINNVAVTATGNTLSFTLGGTINGYFAITVGLLGDTPAQMATNANAFGFQVATATSNPMSFYLSTSKDVVGLTMPNPMFAIPPVPTGSFVSTPVALKWTSPLGLMLPPVGSAGAQDSAAYYSYTYDDFTNMFNTALVAAFNQAVILAANAVGFTTAIQVPYLAFNAATNNFTMYADPGVVPSVQLPGTVNQQRLLIAPTAIMSVSLNAMLADALTFPATVNAQTRWQTLNFSQSVITQTAPYSGQPNQNTLSYAALTPAWSCTGNLWSVVDTIAFVTQQISVRSELTSLPDAGNTVGFTNFTQTSNNSSQIMTDCLPVQSDASAWISQPIIYQPYYIRWTELIGTGELRRVDMQMFWHNVRTGKLNPILMNSGSSMSLKIALFRKDVL